MRASKTSGARRIVFTALALLGVALALLTRDVRPARANPTQYGYFKAAYQSSPLSVFPNTGPHKGCLVCHPTTAGPKTTSPPQFFNTYGAAYNAAGSHATQAAAIQAMRAIESLNSDDDGPIVTILQGDTLANGAVFSSAGGSSCGPPCSLSFSTSASIVLNTATACGTVFSGWSGGGTPPCTGSGACTVRADNRTEIDRGTLPGDPTDRPNITVTATFHRTSCGFPDPDPPNVDLVVTELLATTVGTVGGTIDVVARVRNQGTVTAQGSRLAFVYSTDPTIGTDDTPSASRCDISMLGPGQSQSCQGFIAIPPSLSPGTYYFGAIADALNQVQEIREWNNTRTADTERITLLGPGTAPLRASLNRGQYAAGDLLSLTMLTQATPSFAPVIADFYLVFVVPGGTAFIYDGSGFALVYDGVQLFSTAVRPFKRNVSVTNVSEVILEDSIPSGIPRGVYSFSVFMVRAGTNPLNMSNWLSSPSEATFNF